MCTRHFLSRRRLLQRAGTVAGAAASLGLLPGSARAQAPKPELQTLLADPAAPVLGNPAGNLPVIEFFDYRCPYCRRMHPIIQSLVAEDTDVRFLAKLWPIFGGASIVAARVALGANWQGKFAPVNDALFRVDGPLTEQTIRRAAESAGLDMARLDHDLATRDAEIDLVLARVRAEAHALGLQGTPGFLVGTYLVPGALSAEDLRALVAEARRKNGG